MEIKWRLVILIAWAFGMIWQLVDLWLHEKSIFKEAIDELREIDALNFTPLLAILTVVVCALWPIFKIIDIFRAIFGKKGES